jgi:hypothetical protein
VNSKLFAGKGMILAGAPGDFLNAFAMISASSFEFTVSTGPVARVTALPGLVASNRYSTFIW